MTQICVIPARHESTRLPGKPLLQLGEKSIVQWVYEKAEQSGSFAEVIVATDDDRILDEVQSFGGSATLTSKLHRSGTDRVAEVAERVPSAEIIVNLQADQPFLESEAISDLVRVLVSTPSAAVATAGCPLNDSDYGDPNSVKVVVDQKDSALYFSRSMIPWGWTASHVSTLKHLGIYAFRRDPLLHFTRLAPTPLETAENLEQLRLIEHGYQIGVTRLSGSVLEINTSSDYALAKSSLSRR